MKVQITTEVEIVNILIAVAVCYGDEDIPHDFPLRDGDMWKAVVEIDTGRILDWPKGKTGDMCMKVCDSGLYTLFGPGGHKIAELDGYVPHGVVPGEYGDYINLKINSDGIITNWPKQPDFSEFEKGTK